MRPMNWVQVFVHRGIISAVKTVEFVNGRMSYIILLLLHNNTGVMSLF
jgi:hypothetical protein